MNYDIIKFLNLESIDINLDKSSFVKTDDQLIFTIVLNKKLVNSCPFCGSINTSINDYVVKNITHSISTDKPCILKYKARRFKCKDCSYTFYEKNPFASLTSRTSYYTDALILDKLKSHTATYSSVSHDLNVSIQLVINVFDKFVKPKPLGLSNVICIDEIYTNKLTSRKYCCVILNFFSGELINIFPSRLKNDLYYYFSKYSLEERKKVEYVVIDMWETYNSVAKIVFPYAKVAVDSFHVITHLNTAIDVIRIEVMRKFDKGHSKLINSEMYYYMLKKFHYFFTKSYDKIFEGPINVNKIRTKWYKDEIRKYLLSIDELLTKAYILKEKYQEFNRTAKFESCDDELDDLIEEFLNFPHDAFYQFGKLLKFWREQIKNSFIRIDKLRLSNGKMEGCNSRLKCLIKNANGFKNFDRFKRRCLYAINK